MNYYILSLNNHESDLRIYYPKEDYDYEVCLVYGYFNSHTVFFDRKPRYSTEDAMSREDADRLLESSGLSAWGCVVVPENELPQTL